MYFFCQTIVCAVYFCRGVVLQSTDLYLLLDVEMIFFTSPEPQGVHDSGVQRNHHDQRNTYHYRQYHDESLHPNLWPGRYA